MSKYRLKIKGKRPDTFIEFLIRLHINFIQIENNKEYCVIEVLEEDYEKIKKISTSYEITIVKRYGLAYILYILKTKKLFLISVLLSFIVLITLTHITFSIQIIETDEDIKQLILEDLEQFGIKKYQFKVNYQTKEKIREQILEKEKDILEWLEIEEIGTTYQVKLIKRIKKEEEEVIQPRNIVAKKNGLVVSIEAESGEVVTKKNQYVEKGQVLISGIIKNKEEIVANVAAKGKVYAEIWYKVSMQLPLIYEEETLTGNTKNVLEFVFLNHEIALNELSSYKHAKSTEKILWKHSLLPLRISYTKKQELDGKQINYYESNIEDTIIPLAKEKLVAKLGEDIIIISQKVLKKEQSAGKIKVELFFKVKEDITDYQTIAITQQEIEDQKE